MSKMMSTSYDFRY